MEGTSWIALLVTGMAWLLCHGTLRMRKRKGRASVRFELWCATVVCALLVGYASYLWFKVIDLGERVQRTGTVVGQTIIERPEDWWDGRRTTRVTFSRIMVGDRTFTVSQDYSGVSSICVTLAKSRFFGHWELVSTDLDACP